MTANEEGRTAGLGRGSDEGGIRLCHCRRTAKSVLIWRPILNGNAALPKILIVEDSPDNMKLFRTLLTLKGHEVAGLPNGDGLLDAIERGAPDLVLMDIQLPDRDGYALLKEIRGSPFGTVRVIALTAHAMTGDRERALQAGFDGYITKPIDVRGFPDLVQRALQGERLTG
jgi:two-component system cell cycle response regulator DivK